MDDQQNHQRERVEKVMDKYEGQELKDQFLAIVSQDGRDFVTCYVCEKSYPLAFFTPERLAATKNDGAIPCIFCKPCPVEKPGPTLAELRAAVPQPETDELGGHRLKTKPLDREVARAYAGACLSTCPEFAAELAKVLTVVGIDFCYHDLCVFQHQLKDTGEENADAFNQVLVKYGKLPNFHKRECSCKTRKGVPYTLWQQVTAIARPGLDWEESNIWLKSTFEPTIQLLLKAGVDPNNEVYDEHQPFNVHNLPKMLVERAIDWNDNEMEAERIGGLLQMRWEPMIKNPFVTWPRVLLGLLALIVVYYALVSTLFASAAVETPVELAAAAAAEVEL